MKTLFMENNLLFSDKFNSTTESEIAEIIAKDSFTRKYIN